MSGEWRVEELDPGQEPSALPSTSCGVKLLTGCGLAAVWSPGAGIQEVLGPEGTEPLRLPTLALEGPVGVGGADVEGGTARRLLEGAAGLRVLEEVVVRDGAPGVLLRWSMPEGPGTDGPPGAGADPGSTVAIALPGEGIGGRQEFRVAPGRPVALLCRPADGAAAPGRGSFRVQSRRRAARASLDPAPLTLIAEGPAVSPGLEERVAAAVRALDDAALQEDAEGGARPPFVQGVEAGALVLPAGTPLVEIGLGALAAGRFTLAGAILRTALGEGNVPSLPLLALAAAWGGHTGDTGPLRDGRQALEAAVIRLVSARGGGPDGIPPHGRSFPGAPAALDAFAAAIEPLGDREWTEGVRAAAASLRTGPSGAPKVLPVLGAAPAVPAEEPVLLPPVEGFGHPDDAGLLARRTLHAARLLRAVSEGLLGVHPEAAWGRIRLAPSIPDGWEHMRASGIRVGDTHIDLEAVVEADAVEFDITPSAGRIPLNLVFQPEVPLGSVRRVLLSGEVVDVDVLPGPPGRSGIRFQFPLDERKRVRVEPG